MMSASLPAIAQALITTTLITTTLITSTAASAIAGPPFVTNLNNATASPIESDDTFVLDWGEEEATFPMLSAFSADPHAGLEVRSPVCGPPVLPLLSAVACTRHLSLILRP